MQPLAGIPFLCPFQLAGKGIFAGKIEVSCGDKFEGEFTESDEAGVILFGVASTTVGLSNRRFLFTPPLKVRCRIRPGHPTWKVFALDKSVLGSLFFILGIVSTSDQLQSFIFKSWTSHCVSSSIGEAAPPFCSGLLHHGGEQRGLFGLWNVWTL